jgi:undecaprenyl-diphosphatase
MSAGQAALLGLVEGLTEYLPVSSTGHLVVVERLLGIGLAQDKTSADAYAICIQGGAILAVLVLYLGRVRAMAAGLAGRDPGGRRLAVGVLVAFLPAVVIGLGAGDLIKQHLFGLWPVVGAWLVGGLAILALAWRRRGIPPQQGAPLEQLSLRQALWIGLGQCLAMWPGVSRSLATIAAALLVGLCVPAAVEFSFLLGLVTLLAATTYEALQHAPLIVETFGWFNPLLGFGVAFISAVVAVKWMVAYLNRHSLAIFGYYRIILAVGIALLLWRGILDAGTGS